jgi:hypothetical protein
MPPATTISASPHLVGQVDGVQPRQAHLVHRGGRDAQGDAALDRRLAGGDLAGAGQDHLAHEDVVDLVAGEAGPLQGGGDGEAAQLHGREPAQGP